MTMKPTVCEIGLSSLEGLPENVDQCLDEARELSSTNPDVNITVEGDQIKVDNITPDLLDSVLFRYEVLLAIHDVEATMIITANFSNGEKNGKPVSTQPRTAPSALAKQYVKERKPKRFFLNGIFSEK
ncbi:MAG: hypothetical protein CEN89_464 [Candidatus Berkelbacteria bacterium Licking1014_7]|uniref:Uncharacterized protein n=1 Tax=Candidatus Berkelbacteria bacterium Licking1014_7 TaxID=2017147 RepID=A0A554LIS4_9BACT|nr:MAG: hypothetical protein CEN89_464 [Candidatus Berkelbacteria bacterium Licking1014_7]